MIVVTIELWPFGDHGRARLIGRIEVENDGTGTFGRGNYRARLYKLDGKTVWREGAVVGFDRARRGAYDLLQMVLSATLGRRNGDVPVHNTERDSDE